MTERSIGEPLSSGPRLGQGSGPGTIQAASEEMADKAGSRLDGTRQPLADKLRRAADRVRDTGSRLPGGKRLAGAAQGAADRLESSADYVESRNAQEMLSDLMGLVRAHPAKSLLVAGALGFLVARILPHD